MRVISSNAVCYLPLCRDGKYLEKLQFTSSPFGQCIATKVKGLPPKTGDEEICERVHNQRFNQVVQMTEGGTLSLKAGAKERLYGLYFSVCILGRDDVLQKANGDY